MAPYVGSRYSLCTGLQDGRGRWYFAEREPYRYTSKHTDTRVHIVREGDDLFGLAGAYFQSLHRGCGFWWAIADFQPDPIVDPTLALEVGRRLYIPSERVLTDVILGEARRRVQA